MRLLFTLLLIPFFATSIFSQSCFESLRQKGLEFERQGKYEKAINHYLAAMNCPEREVGDDLPKLIQKSLNARVNELDRARKESQQAFLKLQSATETIVKSVLENAQKDIRNLDYDGALQKYRIAYNQGKFKDEVAKGMMELAFFYGQIGKLKVAQNLADTVAILMHHKELKLVTHNDFHKALLRIDTQWGDSIYHRYFPRMIKVEGGTFTYQKGGKLEKDTTVKTFFIGQTEVTTWQFNLYHSAIDSIIALEPSWGFRGDHPIVLVNWGEAKGYARWLSEKTGQSYQLPGEIEWEFAAIGGNKSNGHEHSGNSEVDSVAWHRGNSPARRPNAVKILKPNELGLYDMSGNVDEWSKDKHRSKSDQKATRGGGFVSRQSSCGVRSRRGGSPTEKLNFIGFRLFRTN